MNSLSLNKVCNSCLTSKDVFLNTFSANDMVSKKNQLCLPLKTKMGTHWGLNATVSFAKAATAFGAAAVLNKTKEKAMVGVLKFFKTSPNESNFVSKIKQKLVKLDYKVCFTNNPLSKILRTYFPPEYFSPTGTKFRYARLVEHLCKVGVCALSAIGAYELIKAAVFARKK